jgi:molybdopterin-dependent oxidoreductase-like protein protein
MRTATLDRVLAVLVVAMAGTGFLALKSGDIGVAWVFTYHGLIGGALLLATVLKARRSLPPAIRAGHTTAVVISLAVTLAITGALLGGYVWVASGRLLAIGPWTLLSWHAWFGLALVPLVVIHLLPRRWRVLRPPPARGGVSRRTVLVTGGLAVAGLAASAATSTLDKLLGGTRRFTGSRSLAPGSIPPPTTFYGEPAPAIDIDAWRLRVDGRLLSLDDLRSVGEIERTAVLDCTSGWAVETTWRGVPLSAVMEIPETGSVRIRSVTGWSTILDPGETREALLATGVAGAPLPVLNGAPCRLVVPGRRGLDWVKWVDEVSVA